MTKPSTLKRLFSPKSLLPVFLLTGCVAAPPVFDTPPEIEEGGDAFAEKALSRLDVLTTWEESDLFRVSPILESDQAVTRLAMMLSALDDQADASLGFEVRIADGGVDEPWLPVVETWAEGAHRVAILDLSQEANALQIRLPIWEVGALDGLTWSMVRPAEPLPVEDNGDGTAQTDQALNAALVALGVRSRGSWGARASAGCGRDYGKDRMAIHHTVTHPHTGGDISVQVRQVQAYHLDGRGWCDVGYHFLVGHDGTIFEGREIQNRGAHVGGHNSGNIGISFVGCFHPTDCPSGSSSWPSEPMLEAGNRLVQSLAGQYGITTDSNTVKGHRDHSGNWTSCPGDYIEDRLDYFWTPLSGTPESGADGTDGGATDAGDGTDGGGSGTSDGSGGGSGGSSGGDASGGDGGGGDTGSGGPGGGLDTTDALDDSYAALVPDPERSGYAFAERNGNLTFFNPGGVDLESWVDGVSEVKDTTVTAYGAWLLREDCEVVGTEGLPSFGDPRVEGETACRAIEATPDGRGYYVLLADGSVRAYGDAPFHGEADSPLEVAPLSATDIAVSPTGSGYWILTGSGEILSFGSAQVMGPEGPLRESPASAFVSLAVHPSGTGLWMLDLEGEVEAFGSARWAGAPTGGAFDGVALDIVSTDDGLGYWVGTRNGAVFPYGTAFYLGSPIGRSCDPAFTDVPPGHPHFQAIQGGFLRGYWLGCSSGATALFCPGEEITRAEFAAILASVLDVPELSFAGRYTDVPAGHWAASSIEALDALGVQVPCSIDGFCPDAPLTRADAAIFLVKAFRLPLLSPIGVFADVAPGHYAVSWIEALAAWGISEGCGSGNYCPSRLLTRGEAAQLVAEATGVPEEACTE